MTQKTVYQIDRAGLLLGQTLADESPLEPGIWLMPAGTVEVEPPECPDGNWPRWDGNSWDVSGTSKPMEAASDNDPVAKLKAFLAANPDVAAIL